MVIWYDNEWGYSNRVVDISNLVMKKMIDKKVVALLIGKKNSTGFPGKNVMDINGIPSCEYGFQAAKRLGINSIFVSPIVQKFQK